MEPCWVVLRSQARREWVAAGSVAARGVESYVPRMPARGDPQRCPLVFPGYVFARVVPGTDELLRIRSVPGLAYVLPRGGPPAHLTEDAIRLLRRREAAPPRPFQRGERVILLAEPFRSLALVPVPSAVPVPGLTPVPVAGLVIGLEPPVVPWPVPTIELEPPLAERPGGLPWLASKRAACVGRGASVLALVLLEAVFVDPLGRADGSANPINHLRAVAPAGGGRGADRGRPVARLAGGCAPRNFVTSVSTYRYGARGNRWRLSPNR